jgi:type II secretory pathway component PulF
MQNDILKSDFFEKFIIRRLYAPKLKHKTNFFRLLSITQKAGLGLRDALVSIRNSESNK